MKIKKKLYKTFVIILLSLLPFLFLNLKGSKNMVAGISDTPEKNVYIDIVKAIDEVYTDGTIKILLCPDIDSMENVINEKVDFHIPHMVDPGVMIQRRPYHYSTEKLGKISVVIYSNVKKPLTAKILDKAARDVDNGKPFPYKIEVSNDVDPYLIFNAKVAKNLNQSFKKLENRTIDAIIWIQEEGDQALKKLNIKSIHRESLYDYDNVILVVNNETGDMVDEIVSAAIKKLKKSGKLDKLYSKLHNPYKKWQP